MAIIKTFISKHSVLTFYTITFVISWGGVLILGAPYGVPATSVQSAKVWPIVFIPYFLGPILTGLLLTGLVHGRTGFRELLSKLFKWRVNLKYYSAALFTAPLLTAVILLTLSLASPAFLPQILTTPDKIGLLLTGLLVGFFEGGLMEEMGWTGFAVPELRRHNGIFATGLIVGFLHAVWHFFPTFWSCGDSSGTLDLLLFLPPILFYTGVLPPYRVLMVWIYDQTKSLLVIILMHMFLSASTVFILSPSATGIQLMIYYLILTTAMWLAVAAIFVTNRVQFKKNAVDKTT